MRVPSVEITIDAVVLHGVAPDRRHEFAAALHEELAALVTGSIGEAERWPARSEASRRVPPINVGDAAPAALGDAVAGTVFGLVTGGGGR